MWSRTADSGISDADPGNVRFPSSYTQYGANLARHGDNPAQPLRVQRPDGGAEPWIVARRSLSALDGGDPSNQAQLVAVRVGHQPGFDRLVFEFAQSAAPGTFGIPAYTIEAASSLSGPSGQPVTINGNALFGTRFQNASTQNPNGTPSYTGSTDMKPTTPLIKQIKLVEDFERVLLWGTGLDHLACPKVTELAGPFRVVLDFPTPP